MSGPMNWLTQVAAVTKFGLLSIPQRRGSVAAAVIGVGGVVAVLVGVLSIAAGFCKTLSASGSGAPPPLKRGGAGKEMGKGPSPRNTPKNPRAPRVGRRAGRP